MKYFYPKEEVNCHYDGGHSDKPPCNGKCIWFDSDLNSFKQCKELKLNELDAPSNGPLAQEKQRSASPNEQVSRSLPSEAVVDEEPVVLCELSIKGRCSYWEPEDSVPIKESEQDGEE